MEAESILIIDKNCKPLKTVLDIVALKSGIKMIYSESLKEGYIELNRKSNNISAVVLDFQFTKQPLSGEEVITGLRNEFPNIPLVVLAESNENRNAAIRCIQNGAYDFLGKNSLDAVRLFQVIQDAIIKKKEKLPVTHRIENALFTNIPAIIFNTKDFCSHFAFKLYSIALQADYLLLDDLVKASMVWHYNFWHSIVSSYSENVMPSINMIKKHNKPIIEFYLIFTLTENNFENLKVLTDEFISSIESFIFSKLENGTKPYIFEPVTDHEDLDTILFPKYNNRSIRLFSQPECWGSMVDYDLNVEDQTQNLKAEFLPAFPIGKSNTNFFLLTQSLLSTTGTSSIAMHVKPLKLAINENEFLKRIITGDISSPNSGIGDSKKDHVARFTEIVNSPFGNYLFEIRFLSDTHTTIPKVLESEMKMQFFPQKSKVQFTYQNGLFDNLFSIDRNLKLARLAFMKNSDEVFRLFRLPAPESKYVNRIPYQNSSLQLFPKNLPTTGILLGEKLIGRVNSQVRIDTESLKKHMYVLGQTGTGKTTLLKTMIGDALNSNCGFCVIDPHGDLFEDVLAFIPEERRKDVVLFDTNNLADSAKLNFFLPGVPVENSMLIDELLRVLSSEYDMKNVGGPIFETYFKSVFKLILHPKVVEKFKVPTIQLAYKALLVPGFLSFLLNLINEGNMEIPKDANDWSESIPDAELQILFDTANKGKGEMEWDNVRPYIYSKLKFFVDNTYIRELFDNKEPTLNFRDIMDSGKILLVRLKKGQIGTANLTKVGRLFLNSLIFSIMSRAELPISQRKDFFVFIDEFQNFLDGDIGSALSEVRKFNVGLILANQTIGQLNDYIFQSVLGNVGSTIFFRTGLNDVWKIRHFFEPDFTTREVVNLQNFNCVARLMNNGKPCEPFIFQTKSVD